jgi:hypothetical protein
MDECRITLSGRQRPVPAPEGCASICTTHDTDQGIPRSETHFPTLPLDLKRKGVIFTAMGALSKIPHNDYSEQANCEHLVGGLAVGIDVKLDNVNLAPLKVARFTRVVVALGSHLFAAGSKTSFGQLKQIAEGRG